ncbi:MAG: transcriptional activator HlyU [Gammaproteobacteria bacterium]|nr:transcriptional activator HlyU [Gammaproteobacteria bacterium]
MGLFSKLFGRTRSGGETPDPSAQAASMAYEGYMICATPQSAGDQWRLAGFIRCETDSGALERHFIRADMFSSRDEAERFALRKGQQIIDEQGADLFADGVDSRRV